MLRYISLFSGMEAASAAFQSLGADAQPVAFSEIDPSACAVLSHKWPAVPNIGNISKFDWSKYRDSANIVLGGSPCQSFSTAGKRLGIEDPRGNLALEYLLAVRDIHPGCFVYENVPGLLTSSGGRDFGTFLDEVERIGYACAWRILDSQFFGVPQRRRRLWIVGMPAGHPRVRGTLAEILDLGHGQEGHPPARGPKRVLDAHLDAERPLAADFRNGRLSPIAATLQRHPTSLNARSGVLEAGGILRRMTPLECQRLQGFPDTWLDGIPLSDAAIYRLTGNSWSVPVASWILNRIISSGAVSAPPPLRSGY